MLMTRQVTVEFPEEAVKAINFRPEQLPQELREAAVLRWFEEGRLSQGQASLLLEMTRGELFDLLAAHRVSPVQMSMEDLEADFRRV
jgi:predicted HTH domain antitoxin